jgi:hypothetical protein
LLLLLICLTMTVKSHKNDKKIFEHPHGLSSSDSKRGFIKQDVVCKFCSTLLCTWTKGRSSHILPRSYRVGRCRQKFYLTNLLRKMRPGVLPMTPKKSDWALNGLVRHSFGRRKWNFKGLASRLYWYIFSNLKE